MTTNTIWLWLTQDGVENHYEEQDPNGIYLTITKLWIDFYNMGGWFIRWEGFGSLKHCSVSWIPFTKKDNLRQNILLWNDSGPNLREYLYIGRQYDSNSRFIYMQRSGTCTMSSILAAMLHHVKCRKLYFLYRLAMGQQILSISWKNASVRKYELFTICWAMDTNFSVGKYFSSIPSGLANFTAQYLEKFIPMSLKLEILIGRGHSIGFKQKQAAIESLYAKWFPLTFKVNRWLKLRFRLV